VTRSKRTGRLDNGPKRGYAVSYGRAPISGRWKRGQSGNPKGRKKIPKTVGNVIEEALLRKVTIEEDGRRVTLTVQEVIIRNLINAAARRDLKAILTLFRLRDHFQDSNETILNPAELDPNDQAIIAGYLEKIQATSSASGQQTTTETKPEREMRLGSASKPNQDSSEGESP
jgi:plasmid maintenance system antidote protein VapI